MTLKPKISSQVQLKIYEMAKTGTKAYVISKCLNLEIKAVQQCIRGMNLPKKTTSMPSKVPTPKEVFAFLEWNASDISRDEAKRKTVITFNIDHITFDLYYNKWRSCYMEKGLD